VRVGVGVNDRLRGGEADALSVRVVGVLDLVSTGVELGVVDKLHDEEKLCVGVNVGAE